MPRNPIVGDLPPRFAPQITNLWDVQSSARGNGDDDPWPRERLWKVNTQENKVSNLRLLEDRPHRNFGKREGEKDW